LSIWSLVEIFPKHQLARFYASEIFPKHQLVSFYALEIFQQFTFSHFQPMAFFAEASQQQISLAIIFRDPSVSMQHDYYRSK
jgi:hypothetical protein